MFSEEIKETVYLAVTLFLISMVVVFFMFGMRLRSDMASVRNAEIQTNIELKSYRQFNKYIGSNDMYGEDIIEAVRGFAGTDIEVYVDSVLTGDIYLSRSMTPAQVEAQYSVEKLQDIVPLGQAYRVFLVFDFGDVRTATETVEFGSFTEVTGIVFKRK